MAHWARSRRPSGNYAIGACSRSKRPPEGARPGAAGRIGHSDTLPQRICLRAIGGLRGFRLCGRRQDRDCVELVTDLMGAYLQLVHHGCSPLLGCWALAKSSIRLIHAEIEQPKMRVLLPARKILGPSPLRRRLKTWLRLHPRAAANSPIE